MSTSALSVRAFVGAKDYEQSRAFYRALDFEEVVIDARMSYFRIGENLGFYLQCAFVKDWVDNTMLLLEVADPAAYREQLLAKELPKRFPGVRLSAVRREDWGQVCFLHDPSGVLWQIGAFGSVS